MARFKYMGEEPRPYVLTMGNCMEVRLPTTNGDKLIIKCPNPNGWVKGDELGVDVTDARALRCLRADPRFEEIK